MAPPESTIAADSPVPESDLYSILNVSPSASSNELRGAFRRLSQMYHPDKHSDAESRAAATEVFMRIKEAYEILFNEKLRRIYDEFGLEAARTASSPSMELTPYSELKDCFEREGKDGSGTNGPRGTPRDAYFTVINSVEPRVDATGLVVALEDGTFANGAPLATVSHVGLSSMATAIVSQNTSIIAQYSIKSRDRSSHVNDSIEDDFSLSVRQQLDSYSHAEATAYVPVLQKGSMSYGFKAVRSLSQHTTMSLEAAYQPLSSEATTMISSTRVFGERHAASLSWATGSSPGVSFQWRRDAYHEYVPDGSAKSASRKDKDDEEFPPAEFQSRKSILLIHEYLSNFLSPVGMQWAVRFGVLDQSLTFTVRRPIGEAYPLFQPCEPSGPGGPHVKLRGHVGVLGWEVEAGGGRHYVLSDTAWSMSIAIGSHGVIWRLKMNRAGHRFQLPVVLVSSSCDPKIATLAAIATSACISAVQSLIIMPIVKQRHIQERNEAKALRQEYLKQAQKDAERAKNLIQRRVQSSREYEEAVVIDGNPKSGLLIARAVYGLRETVVNTKFSDPTFFGREIEMEVIEVEDCVQALVEDSHIQVVSTSKSTLMGFWDPTAFGEKGDLVIRIWYTFKGFPHECLLQDDEPLEIPVSDHRVRSWT